MRLGGPVFVSSKDPAELARAHREAGYRAAYCPEIASLDDRAACRAVEAAFAAQDVVIAEVGAWCNIIGPDEAERRRNLAYVCERLALADEVGALGCVDYAGTLAVGTPFGADPRNLSPEAFDRIVETVREVLAAARPRRAKFMLEMMPWVFPDDAESYARLLAAVDDEAFGVHLDPVNVITSPRRYFDTGRAIREIVATLGRHIVSCHAKDVRMTGLYPVGLEECPPGDGGLDYGTFLAQVAGLPQRPPVMLEHLQTPQQYAAAREHLLGVARRVGVDFEREDTP